MKKGNDVQADVILNLSDKSLRDVENDAVSATTNPIREDQHIIFKESRWTDNIVAACAVCCNVIGTDWKGKGGALYLINGSAELPICASCGEVLAPQASRVKE